MHMILCHYLMPSAARRVLVLIVLAALACHSTAHASAYVKANRLWPSGVVPYVWDDDLPQENRDRVTAAMNIWMDATPVTFVLRTDETDYVLIQNAAGDDGSSSPTIGRGGNKQNLYIRQDLSGITDFGLAHELGHVLGFHHTHQRPDRDDYVTWYKERTTESGIPNFEIAPNALGYPRNAMDYNSVMSYGRCTFAICEDCKVNLDTCRVLEINDANDAMEFDAKMGQREYLTRLDAMVMSFMYPPAGWRFIERDYPDNAESGTFHYPYLTVDKALTDAPNNATVWVQPGNYESASGTFNKPMLLRAPLGEVAIRLQ